MIWEMLIGGIVVLSFLAALVLWVLSALRKVRRMQLRRNAFVSSALNNLSHGVVMTDARRRIVFCNDRYLEIYGLARSDISKNMTGPELLELRRKRGVLAVSVEYFYAHAATREGLVTELPGGRSVLVKYFTLPNGGGDARGLQRAAPAFAAAGIDQAVPGIGPRQCAGLRGRQEHRGRPLHLRQPCVRAVLALFPRPYSRQARR
jgi:PAS domain-containing protein